MKFKITVMESRVTWMTKVFEADSEDDARHLAEADDSWTDLDGWAEGGERTGESAIETIMEVKE